MTRKQDVAYAYLKGKIAAGELIPGERIVPNRIAREIGMSGVPVREALLKLQSERLVTITPHTGSAVATATPSTTIQTLEVVSLLEGYVTRLAHARIAPRLPRLRALNRDLHALLKTGAFDRFSQLNRAFHEEIYLACDNAVLIETIRGLWVQLDSLMSGVSFYLIPHRAASSLKEHERMVALLADPRTDLAALEMLAREHGLKTARALQEMPKAALRL